VAPKAVDKRPEKEKENPIDDEVNIRSERKLFIADVAIPERLSVLTAVFEGLGSCSQYILSLTMRHSHKYIM